jgi:hypothetical protein
VPRRVIDGELAPTAVISGIDTTMVNTEEGNSGRMGHKKAARARQKF